MLKRNDLKVIGHFIDEGESAKTDNRSELKRLILPNSKKVNGLINLLLVTKVSKVKTGVLSNMIREPIKILAINPGARYLGIAIFRGAELRDWRVKVAGGKWSEKKVKNIKGIILSLIDKYEPSVLAIKKLNPCRSSSNLTRLTNEIKNLVKKKGLRVYQYSLNDLESFFSPKNKINKKKMSDIVTREYTALCHELKKEKSNKNPYYIRMFEAVALGLVCFHKLDRH